MKPIDKGFTLNSFPCLIKSDFVRETTAKCFPCRRRDSFCCWGKDATSSFEILVLCKGRSPSHCLSDSSSSPSASSASDVEVRCKRLASKLSEFIAPEHFVSTLF